jgi:hypothetical protein
MAVHPFARQCEQAIAKLREILANLRRAKKDKPDSDSVPTPAPPKYGTLADIPLKWLLPPPGMEFQAGVLGSTRGLGGTITAPKGQKPPKPPKPSGDPTFDRLLFKVQIERYKCYRRHLVANQAYYRCLHTGSKSSCKGLFRQTPCPEAQAAQKELDDYVKTLRNESNTPGWSDGGGGGGW